MQKRLGAFCRRGWSHTRDQLPGLFSIPAEEAMGYDRGISGGCRNDVSEKRALELLGLRVENAAPYHALKVILSVCWETRRYAACREIS